MSARRWELIKRRAAEDLCLRVDRGLIGADGDAILWLLQQRLAMAEADWRGVMALKGLIAAVVDNWDIRASGRLRDLVPRAFPGRLARGVLECWIDDRGNWLVDRAEEPNKAGAIAPAERI